ncbi:MAG TPA: hypothetical protein VKP69_11135, partial [Isosphaeraceae bacterium]|nr:hypothetical protein [Isosphaeraceae bacterium]
MAIDVSAVREAAERLRPWAHQPSGDPWTIADGLRTPLGTLPFSFIRRRVDAIVTATEAEILDVMRFVGERSSLVGWASPTFFSTARQTARMP